MDWLRRFLFPDKLYLRQKREDAIVWLVFSVGMSMVPLVISYCIRCAAHSLDYNNVLCNVSPKGELLLVTVGMSAAATGRLLTITTERSKKIYKTIISCFSILTMVTSAAFYGAIPIYSGDRNGEMITQIYLVMYLCGFIFSFLCFVFSDHDIRELESSKKRIINDAA
ncbi:MULTISPECIES: hypothetical protein [unclassified Maridesulfovibrio]|uniref:hypothetical protein n=1 Tax=unclassified Maridesulfovibrio TaxID=2794999 RepID=UPI003B40B34A